MAKYQEMMLKGDSFQASYYLKDAIKEAQNDVSLRSLAIVYLGECAMQKAMGLKTQCQSYESLKNLFKDSKFEAYKAMLLSQKVKNPADLHKYQSFYEALEAKSVTLSDIKSLDTIYAQAIAARLVYEKGQITKDMLAFMIEQASSENLKGLMLVWLDIAKDMAAGEEKIRLDQKIRLLQAKP
jgi:hypothetical protein